MEVTDYMFRIVKQPFNSSYFKTWASVQPVCTLRTENLLTTKGLNQAPSMLRAVTQHFY